jgi:hypothetical protein
VPRRIVHGWSGWPPDSFGGSGCRSGWGGGGSDVLDPNGPWGDGVHGDHESIRPCCMALPPAPRTRRPVDPTVACPGAPTPAPSPWPVRLLGPRALLLDPHPTRIRGLRRRLRLLPAHLTHRRAEYGRGAARAVAADAVTGTVAARGPGAMAAPRLGHKPDNRGRHCRVGGGRKRNLTAGLLPTVRPMSPPGRTPQGAGSGSAG